MFPLSYQICDLFKNSETQLGKLITQAHSLSALNEMFIDLLEPELVSHCRIGGYHHGVLTLFVETAAYATRLRYSTAHLMSKLRAIPKWAGLASIQVKVQTFQHFQITKTEACVPCSTPLPQETVQQLKALIEDMKRRNGDDVLVKSLERLANLESL